MRADGALAVESSEQHAEISEEHRRLNIVLNEIARNTALPPEEGQWDGGRIKDTYDDLPPATRSRSGGSCPGRHRPRHSARAQKGRPPEPA